MAEEGKLGSVAAEEEDAQRSAAAADENAQLDHLVFMMASLGLGVGEHQSAAAAAPFGGETSDEGATAVTTRFWGQDAAPVSHFVQSIVGHSVVDAYAPAPAGTMRGTGRMARPRVAPRHEERHFRRGRVVDPGQGAVTLPARPGGVFHGDNAYLAAAPVMHGAAPVVNPRRNPETPPSDREQEVLLALFHQPAESIVSYACSLMESTHGQRLFRLVFVHCNLELREWIIASITRDMKSFWRICAQRSAEVVCMIEYAGTRRSLLLLREAMLSWMAPNLMHSLVTDSNRVRVVLAFIQHSPRDVARFIFEAVSRNCIRLACQQNGLNLLQDCLLFQGSQKEKDDIFTKISYQSLYLSQNSSGNYIVQDVLKKGNLLHFAIIASCLRTNYVGLSRQKYSSNVVEQCLRVFDECERFVIVNELISYPHFRDLVTDEFANFVLSTALQTCNIPLQDLLARAILSQNISYRNQHCLKIFNLLSKFGYMH